MTSPGTALPEVALLEALSSFPDPWVWLVALGLGVLWRWGPHLLKYATVLWLAKMPPEQARQGIEALRASNDHPTKDDAE